MSGLEKVGFDGERTGGGGGVAGGRGTTLGRATKLGGGTASGGIAGVVGSGASPWLAGGANGEDGRGGGGGGAVRGPLGRMPREDGGSGMRETGAELPAGRGTMLTGRGTTLTGAVGGTEAVGSTAEGALGSFSSPIDFAQTLRASDFNPKRHARARFRV